MAGLLMPVSLLAKTPNDHFFIDQWYLNKIGAESAWDITTGSDSVIIAVLDTGVDLDHPDLAQNLWKNSKEIPGNGIDDDKNGYIDDVDGWDFVEHDISPVPTNSTTADPNASPIAMSHGTLIAGIIGAVTDNEIGYAGIDWHVKIMPLRILNEEGGGGEEEAVNAIKYAVKNGAKVINLSFVGDDPAPALRQAVADAYHAGVTIVAALGNDAKDVNLTPVYPACFRSGAEDWVLGISATDENDEETEFTNFGSDCADLSAPGTNIQGLTLSHGDAGLTGSQIAWDGTSAASPMVAGTVGLILGAFPDLSPDQIRSALKLSVDPIKMTVSGPGALGVGRLNIARALSVAQAIAGTAPAIPIIAPSQTPTPASSVGLVGYASYSFVALGAAAGEPPNVRVYKADGTPYAEFFAFAPTFLGGVRVTLDDLDGDSIPEVITSAGPGGGPQIRIFTATGALIRSFFAFDDKSRQGVSVAMGDVDDDYSDEIVAVVGAGVSNEAIVYGQDGIEKFRFPVSGSPVGATPEGFAPGTPLTVTTADVDDDYNKEIIFAGLSGSPRVAVYDNDGKPLVDFLAYSEDVTGGLSLASGDFDGDLRDEIVTAPRASNSANIRIFNKIGALWGQFTVEGQSTTGAVVSVSDMDVDGSPDIVLAPEHGAGEVRIFTPHGSIMGTLGSKLVGAKGTNMGAW